MRRCPPANLGLKNIQFSSQRKERREQRCSCHKSNFHFDCPQRKSRLRCYNYSVQHEILYRRRSREAAVRAAGTRGPASLCMWVSGCVIAGYIRCVFCVSRVVPLWCSSKQLLRMIGKGWASVLNTQSSRGSRSSSEKSRYRYLTFNQTINQSIINQTGNVFYILFR